MNEAKTSSIVDKHVQPINKDGFKSPTFALVGVLFIAFIILKTFIYIKDGDRHGK